MYYKTLHVAVKLVETRYTQPHVTYKAFQHVFGGGRGTFLCISGFLSISPLRLRVGVTVRATGARRKIGSQGRHSADASGGQVYRS